MKALEAEEQETRINSLRFMIDTSLITDLKIRNGLEDYLNKKAPIIPQFKPTALSYPFGIIVPSTAENIGFTDFDVFVCDADRENEVARSQARIVIDILRQAGRVGRVSLKEWRSYEEDPLAELRNKLTIIVDRGHKERDEVPRLQQQFQAVRDLPEMQVLDNRGKSSPWLISVVVCPLK